MTRYEKGFIEKCAEYGIDGQSLLKSAMIIGGPTPPKGMLGSMVMGGPGQVKMPSFGVMGESSGAKMPSFGVMGERQAQGKGGLLDKLVSFARVMPSGTHVKMGPLGPRIASQGEVADYKRKRLSALATGTGMAGGMRLRRLGLPAAGTVS